MTTAAFRFASGASLAKYQATAAEVVPLALDSVDGVRTVTWSVVSTDETSAGQWTITNPTSIAGATLTAPGSGTAKACIVECVVNNGSETDPRTGRQVEGDLRKRAKAYVGTEVACVGEVNESDATFGWVPLVNTSIRIGGGTGVVAPTPDTLPQRDSAGALLATAFQGDATGAVDTVLARSGDTRIVLQGSGVIALQRWIGSAWVTRCELVAGSDASPLGLSVGDRPIVVDLLDEGTLNLRGGGNPPYDFPPAGEVALSGFGGALVAHHSDSTMVRVSRAEPSLHSSGAVTLDPDGVYIISGTATAGALPEASTWIGIRITVRNRTAGALSIARSGSDTIDGATSYSLPSGAAVTFMADASGSIAVQSDAGVGGDSIVAVGSVRMRAVGSGVIEIDRWDGAAWERSGIVDASNAERGLRIVDHSGGAAIDVGGASALAVQIEGPAGVGVAGTMTHDAGDGAVATYSEASGAYSIAAATPMRVQPAAPGSGAGRALTLGGSPGATPGTNLAGDVNVELGATVSGVSAAMIFRTAGTERMRIYRGPLNGGTSTLESAESFALSNVTGGITLTTPNAVILTATQGVQHRAARVSRLSPTVVVYSNAEVASATIASATTTNVVTFATTSNRVYQAIGYITVSNDTDDQGAAYWVRAAFKNVGGTVTQIGATQTIAADLEDAGQTGLSAVLDFTGTTIRLRLVTDSGDTVNVNGELELHERVLA